MNEPAQSCFMMLQHDITNNFLKYSLGKIAIYEIKVPMTGKTKNVKIRF